MTIIIIMIMGERYPKKKYENGRKKTQKEFFSSPFFP